MRNIHQLFSCMLIFLLILFVISLCTSSTYCIPNIICCCTVEYIKWAKIGATDSVGRVFFYALLSFFFSFFFVGCFRPNRPTVNWSIPIGRYDIYFLRNKKKILKRKYCRIQSFLFIFNFLPYFCSVICYYHYYFCILWYPRALM